MGPDHVLSKLKVLTMFQRPLRLDSDLLLEDDTQEVGMC